MKLPYDDWWNVIVTSRVDGVDGLFVHPVQDPGVMAGNGTIGLEILEDLPDPDAVVIPYGGGGLTVGIASAIKALRPGTKIFTAEPDDRPPRWPRRFAAGHPADVDYQPSFVDGSGSRRVLDSMWPLVHAAGGRRGGHPDRRGRRRGADCSPSGSGSSPKARARSRRPPR